MTTKTTQFTPGPWVVNTFIVNGQHKLEVLDATGDNACIQANANLIAAAPAMYEALRNLLEVYQDSTDDDGSPAVLSAINALAQAEGKHD